MLKVNGISFSGTGTISNNNITAPDVQADKKISTKAKVAIGSSLTALAAVGIYLVTKNSKAAKAIAEEAKKFGFEDIKTFKQLKNAGINFEKVENANYADLITDSSNVIKQTTNEKGERIAEIGLLSKDKTVEMLKSIGITTKIPENSFVRTITYNNEAIKPNYTMFVYDKMDNSILDFCGEAWKNGKIYIRPVSNK